MSPPPVKPFRFDRGRVGPNNVRDGLRCPIRMTNDASGVVQDAHAKYYEAVLRGNVYVCSTNNLNSGTFLGTSLANVHALALYNPVASGVNLVLIQACVTYFAGTLGSGTVVYSGGPSGAITSGVGAVATNALIGSGKVPIAFFGVGTSNQTLIRPAFSMGAFSASTQQFGVTLKDQIDGEFMVPPGCIFGIQGILTAGTSPAAQLGMTWEEVPI